jgi:type 1 glutamine amidotransferase
MESIEGKPPARNIGHRSSNRYAVSSGVPYSPASFTIQATPMKRILLTLVIAAVATALLCLNRVAVNAARAADPKDDAGWTGKKIKALLVIGGCCHDYGRQKQILQKGISARAPVEFTVVHEGDGTKDHRHSIYEKAEWWKGYDVVIHDECTSAVVDLTFIQNILAAHKAGVPAVVLHCGMHSYRSEGHPNKTPWFDFTGLRTAAHGPKVPIEVTISDKENQIMKGVAEWKTGDEELYNNLAGNVEPTAHPLMRGRQMVKGKPVETIVTWTNTYGGKTKVFATTLGHSNDTVADARYLNLVTRGLLWAVDKLDDQHFKPSDTGVDVKTIPADERPGGAKNAPAKKAAASENKADAAKVDQALCCGQ